MLNRDKKIFGALLPILLLFGCNTATPDLKKESQNIIGKESYDLIYDQLQDSLNIWVLNKFPYTEAETIYPYKLDSLLCVNTTKDRLITCRHLYVNIPDANSDDLQFLYGEKINNQWFFLKGASIVIPRSMAKDHDIRKPLSYLQLHEIALKEVYSGYLDGSGNINEDWFKNHFENVGMCAECKTSEDFRKSFLISATAQWANRDTTQPIKHLDKNNKPLP